jgi:hypothetical protein
MRGFHGGEGRIKKQKGKCNRSIAGGIRPCARFRVQLSTVWGADWCIPEVTVTANIARIARDVYGRCHDWRATE